MAYHAKRQGEDAFSMATLFVINAIKHGWKKAENWGVFPVQK